MRKPAASKSPPTAVEKRSDAATAGRRRRLVGAEGLLALPLPREGKEIGGVAPEKPESTTDSISRSSRNPPKPLRPPEDDLGEEVEDVAGGQRAPVADPVGHVAPRDLQSDQAGEGDALDQRDLEDRDAARLPVKGRDRAIEYHAL